MQLYRLDFHPFLLLSDLPELARPLVAELLLEDPEPVEALAASVAARRSRIERAAAYDESARVALGVTIAKALEAFLRRVDERTPLEQMWVIHATVRFFVFGDDGAGDELLSDKVLLTEARVVNAMLRWFGRDDLLVPLPPDAVIPLRTARPRRAA